MTPHSKLRAEKPKARFRKGDLVLIEYSPDGVTTNYMQIFDFTLGIIEDESYPGVYLVKNDDSRLFWHWNAYHLTLIQTKAFR